MNSKLTLIKIQKPFIKSLTIFSLSFSLLGPLAQAQHDHHKQAPALDAASLAVKVTEKPLVVSTENCPLPTDKAFVNFDESQLKDPPGFHGMLFFGQGDTFYISHLPMFHKPHDYQAIVEVRLKPEVKAKYQAALAKSGGYFSFAPNGNFVLPDVITKKKPITGSLVQGHFERGGTPLLNTELELVRVVFYKKLEPKEKKPTQPKYIMFGKGDEYFMAHEVAGQPSMDEIIPLPKGFVIPPQLKAQINADGLTYVDKVDVSGTKVKAIKNDRSIEAPHKEFYRETGDLQ